MDLLSGPPPPSVVSSLDSQCLSQCLKAADAQSTSLPVGWRAWRLLRLAIPMAVSGRALQRQAGTAPPPTTRHLIVMFLPAPPSCLPSLARASALLMLMYALRF